MPKKLTADRVIPAIVDTAFVLLMIAGFNIMVVGVLEHLGDLRGSEILDAGFWDLAPASLGVFIGVRALQIAGQTIDHPTRLSKRKGSNEKEEETE